MTGRVNETYAANQDMPLTLLVDMIAILYYENPRHEKI